MTSPKPTANRPVDIRVYEEELCPWLPPKIIDCHVHIGLKEHRGPITPERLKTNWAYEVGVDQSWEELQESFRLLFPRQQVSALVMGVPFREMDLASNNLYIVSGNSDLDTKALFVTRPEWEAANIDAALQRGFVGIKPYPDLVVTDGEPSIFDFLPRDHLAALNRHAGILMLHIPREGRLADLDNIKEIVDIAERYTAIKIIVAHIGRAFCLPTAEKGLPHFKDVPRVLFDNAANLNPDVLALALEIVGPSRILYGSDLPITLMRGMREHHGERYTNFTDGDYSWNTVRKPPEVEANYTYFLYEEIRALIEAVKRTGGGKETLEQIMYSNMARLLSIRDT